MAQEPGMPSREKMEKHLEIRKFESEKFPECVNYIEQELAKPNKERKLAFDPKAMGFLHPESADHERLVSLLEGPFLGLDISVKEYNGIPHIRISWEDLDNLKEDSTRVAVTATKAGDYTVAKRTVSRKVYDLLKKD